MASRINVTQRFMVRKALVLAVVRARSVKDFCFALHEEHDAVAPQSVHANFRETLHFEALAAKK